MSSSSSDNKSDGGAGSLAELSETLSSVFQKRTRALRKKVRNVEEIEKKVEQGKAINSQQEEAIRGKTATLALLEEVEKLRKAVEDEVQTTIATKEAEEKKRKRRKKREEKLAAVKEEEEKAKTKLELEKKQQKEREEKDKQQAIDIAAAVEESKKNSHEDSSANVDQAIEKLLKVFYFGRLFDTSMGNTLAHYERAAYLGYDGLMTERANDPAAPGLMTQKHLDGLAAFAYYLSSRPMNQLLSHKQALDQCVALAKQFLDEKKEKRMEVPLPDGTFCDLEAMIDRVTLTGFFSAVPQLQSFGDFSSNTTTNQQQQQQQEGLTPSALEETAIHREEDEEKKKKTTQSALPQAQTNPHHQQAVVGGVLMKEEEVAVAVAATTITNNNSEKKYPQRERRERKAGSKGSKGPRTNNHPPAVNNNVPALAEMDANQHVPTASVNFHKKSSSNGQAAAAKRERNNNNTNLSNKKTSHNGGEKKGNLSSNTKEGGDFENKGTTTKKNWRSSRNGNSIRKGGNSKRGDTPNPKQHQPQQPVQVSKLVK
jgi:hypothetical protein